MSLVLEGVSKVVEGHHHIYPTDLSLERGTMNVLLGPTLSGKDIADADHGGAGCARNGPRAVGRAGRDRNAGAGPQSGDGLSAVHQLPVHDRL